MIALAVAAHPDDIEFVMAGTLLLLRERGWAIHYMTLANGSCGSRSMARDEIVEVRRTESMNAAALLGCTYHESLVDDMHVVYGVDLLRRVAAVVRRVRPRIMLVPSPADYMEDHTETSRLAVSAAFVRGMPNFETDPPEPAVDGDVTVYHAMPQGLRDGLRHPVRPDVFVDTTAVHEAKRAALAAHASQAGWLDASQGITYLEWMDQMSREVGELSGRSLHAEGWRRHNHLGLSADDCPLTAGLNGL